MSTDTTNQRDAQGYCSDCFFKKDGLCHHTDLQGGFADQRAKRDALHPNASEITAMLVDACKAQDMKVGEEKDAVDRTLEDMATSLRFAGFGLISFKTGGSN
ncbi:MAG: hypothetical protein K2X45_07980 [Phreatobacter sp.]|nr:hypothetical protein [Phreatobacter sp.]